MAQKRLYLFDALIQYSKNKFLIWRTSNLTYSIYTYEEILSISRDIECLLRKNNVPGKSRISIKLGNDTPSICATILGILNHSNSSFCPISPEGTDIETKNTMQRYGSVYLVTQSILKTDFKLCQSISVFQDTVYLYHIIGENLTFETIPEHCYSIQTSGTTGIPKIVHVPYNCILPNIDGLSLEFEITSSDVIFLGSPPTFDPFVIELFLAIKNGASLLIVSNDVRVSPLLLAQNLFPDNDECGVTILQMTPSVFLTFGDNIVNRIMNSKSSLRVLVLGGEFCPYLDKLKQWLRFSLPKTLRIYNIYGITEVSCWSTIYQISQSTSEYIPLGIPIDESTVLQVKNDKNEIVNCGEGELFLGSSKRICSIDNEKMDVTYAHPVFRSTGDLVEFVNNEIVYKERLNEVVKRFGYRTNLRKIEKTILRIEGVSKSAAIFISDESLLVLFVVAKPNIRSEDILINKLSMNLEKHERPDRIQFLDSFPISSHGKLSKAKLIKMYTANRRSANSSLEIFEEFLTNVFGLKLRNINEQSESVKKRRKSILDSTFYQAGGTSFQALTLVTEIEKLSNTAQPTILELMLSNSFSISSIIEKLRTVKCVLRQPITQEGKEEEQKYKCNILWSYNTEKCVDATPTVFGNSIVSIGSHSHTLYNLNAADGKLISSIKLSDRIESQVSFFGTCETELYGYVGCYDGFLYKFNPMNGAIIWSFKTNGMIKTQPLIIKSLVLVCNYSYDHNVLAFSVDRECLLWSIKLGTKGIFSSPIQLDMDSVLVATLDGTFARINYKDGQIIWSLQLSSPIFGNCVKFNNTCFLIAEVKGLVHCFDKNDGNELWSFPANGTIFSSFCVQNRRDKVFIVFGSHDKFLYCLTKDPKEKGPPSLHWKTELNSQIYSTPQIYKESNIVAFCITGQLNFIEIDSGLVTGRFKLPGEVFSTPTILDDQIIVGCRDDSVYGIHINQI